MIKIRQNNYGQGVNRYVERDGKIIATIHHHPRWSQEKLPDAWNVCRISGRVDWFPTLSEARSDALKG